MENIGYLFAVFAIIWVALFAYVISLIRRQQQLNKDIQLIKESLEKSSK